MACVFLELWVSPVRRTLLTMAPTALAVAKRPKVHTSLYEAGGVYEGRKDYTEFVSRPGMTRAEMAEAHPDYVLPSEVTDRGWYLREGKETVAECRDRAARIVQELKAKAAALEVGYHSLVLVVHNDIIGAILDAFVAPGTTGHFTRWRNFNTALTVFDVDAETGHVAFIAVNAIPHLDGKPNLVSGFKL